MQIGELARRAGVSPRALRYYEQQGLLRPARRLSGYRQYSEADVETVRRIRALLAARLGTSTIAEVLPCMATEGGQLVTPCSDLVERLQAERDRIESEAQDLLSARDMLDAIIAASRSSAVACEADEGAGRAAVAA